MKDVNLEARLDIKISTTFKLVNINVQFLLYISFLKTILAVEIKLEIVWFDIL